MTINYTPAFDSATYLQRLKDFMKAVEGEEFAVYVDSTGNPTIGWGFALNSNGVTGGITDVIEKALGVYPNRNNGGLSPTAKASEQAFEKSLKAILNKSWPADNTIHHTGQSTTDLRAELKKVLDQRAADIKAHKNGYTAADEAAIGTPSTTFAYSTVNQISATFGIIKTEMDRRLGNAFGGIPDTNERIALFAMQYLGAMNDHMEGLLKKAFSQSDPADARAQAWYAIRYQNPAGWASRSYAEAAMFGLYYDNSNVSDADAKAVYRMFTMYRETMLAYDRAHTADLSNADVYVKKATGGALGALSTAHTLAACRTSLTKASIYKKRLTCTL
jgi:GH24 family phage-related lysozyme (muramidase)